MQRLSEDNIAGNECLFFSDNEGERIQIPLKVGHHRPSGETPWPSSETPFKWRFTGGPMMAQH